MPVNFENISSSQNLQIYSDSTVRQKNFLKNFSKGDLVTGSVIKRLDTFKYEIKIGDQIVNARSELQLIPGRKVFLQFISVKPEIELKIISGSEQIKDIESLLSKFDLENNRINNGIIKTLMEFSIPVSKKEVYLILNKLNEFNFSNKTENIDNYIKAAVFLNTKGLSIRKDSLGLLAGLFSDKPILGDELYNIFNFLTKESGNLSQWKALLDSFSLPFSDALSGHDIQNIVNMIGYDFFKKIFTLKNKEEILTTLKAVLYSIQNEKSGNILIAEQVDKIIDSLNSIILYNTEKEEGGARFPVYLAFPFAYDNKTGTVELFLSRQSEKNKNKNLPVLVTLLLEMSGFSKLIIEGKVSGKQISLIFKSEIQDVLDFLFDHKNLVAEKLKSKDYTLSGIEFLKIEDFEIERNIMFMNNEKEKKRIDFRI